MELMLAFGVPVRWARGGPADFVPLIAVLAALLVARFVIGARLTWTTSMVAATCGTAWAWAIAQWGIEVPTLLAVIATAVLAISVGRARSA